MAKPISIDNTVVESPYLDLYDGPNHCINRLRQISVLVQDYREHRLWPLTIVSIATCLEWFARSTIKELIDYAPDHLNPNARLLRDLKLNFSLAVQSHRNQFSVGDLVAVSRNYSTFTEINEILIDILNAPDGSFVDSFLLKLKQLRVSPKALTDNLDKMFRKRHELVHGTPRYLSYSDEFESFVSKSELISYVTYALKYIKTFRKNFTNSIPELGIRSTIEMNQNQLERFQTAVDRMSVLVASIEKNLDPRELNEFRKSQKAWEIWRSREASFQSMDWFGGTGRTAILTGHETSITMARIRQLEFFIRRNGA